ENALIPLGLKYLVIRWTLPKLLPEALGEIGDTVKATAISYLSDIESIELRGTLVLMVLRHSLLLQSVSFGYLLACN
ncbi:MAG: hypothetical protein AAFX57_17820, partial [Bacteroidota bacterium]